MGDPFDSDSKLPSPCTPPTLLRDTNQPPTAWFFYERYSKLPARISRGDLCPSAIARAGWVYYRGEIDLYNSLSSKRGVGVIMRWAYHRSTIR